MAFFRLPRQRFKQRTTASLLAINTLLASGVALTMTSLAYAESAAVEKRYYNIPAGPLSQAVNTFAAVSGMYLGGNGALLKNKKTLGFVGEYSTGQALDLLLIGTGLLYEAGEGRSIVLIDTESVSKSENGITMSTLLVQGRQNKAEAGVQVIGSEEIEAMPTEGGNLTDLLRTNTAVNYSRDSSDSGSSASLRPDEISIHGQDYYQNAFMIDGVDTSSDFDPGSSGSGDTYSNPINPKKVSTLSGGSPQSYYVDVDAIGEVKVYDSNIPVEYGGFMGGVVDAKLKRYEGEDFIFIKYGLSKDAWEKFHVNFVDDGFNYGDSYDGSYTPKYKKQNYSITAIKGWNDKVSSTVTASRKTSRFKQSYISLSDDQQNEIYYNDSVDNLMGRVDVKASEKVDLGFSFKYSNRYYTGLTSTSFTAPFERFHEAYGLSTDMNYKFEDSEMKVTIGFDRSLDSLDSDSSINSTYLAIEKGGNLYYEGGFGDISQQQDKFTLNTKWVHDPIVFGSTEHAFTVGANLTHTNAFYSVDGDIVSDTYRCSQNYICNDYSEETLSQKTAYSANKLEKNYENYGVYFQDAILNGNWKTTLGVRADRETLLDNVNISPRANVEWNVFGDDSTRLIAGANRYYGRSFFKYEINQTIESWKTTTTYNYKTDGSVNKVTVGEDKSLADFDLDTPYSDELMFGWVQRMGPVDATLKLVNRESRDAVRKTRDDDGKYFYTNEGESSTNSVSLSFEQRKPFTLLGSDTRLSFAVGWQESKSDSQSNEAYDQTFKEDPVFYKGKVIDISELPSWDYNIPFTVKLSSNTVIPAWHLKWSNFVNVKSGGTVALDSKVNDLDNGLDIYEDKDFDDLVTVDSQIQWRPSLFASSEGYLQIKVTNLFDQVASTNLKTTVSTKTFSFTSGRKISMEVGMRF